MYKIDGKDLSELGAMPVRASDEVLALSGFMSLPKRTGTTEYDWGTSIEPFVSQEDIILDGRTLTLYAVVKGASNLEMIGKLQTLFAACVSCKTLCTDYDTFKVLQKDEIKVTTYKNPYLALVEIPFWEPDYIKKEVTITASGTGEYRLDGYDLNKDFGLYIASDNELYNEAGRIDVETTLTYRNTSFRSAMDKTITCYLWGGSLKDMYNRICQFESVCIAPGTRILRVGNVSHEIYFKSGIDTKVISDKALSISLKCRIIN